VALSDDLLSTHRFEVVPVVESHAVALRRVQARDSGEFLELEETVKLIHGVVVQLDLVETLSCVNTLKARPRKMAVEEVQHVSLDLRCSTTIGFHGRSKLMSTLAN
jgi:hypothetical protein